MSLFRCALLMLLLTILTCGCATSKVWEKNTHGTFKKVQENNKIASQIYFDHREHLKKYRFHKNERKIYIPFKASQDTTLLKNSFPPYLSGVIEIKTGEHFDRISKLLSDKHFHKIELFFINIRKTSHMHNETLVKCYLGAYLTKNLNKFDTKALESDQLFISDQSGIPKYKLRSTFNEDSPLIFPMDSRGYLPVYWGAVLTNGCFAQGAKLMPNCQA